MKKTMLTVIAALGMFSFAFCQSQGNTNTSATGDCYYYSVKDGNSTVKITVTLQLNQSIATATIFREIYVEGKEKTSMTQKASIEGTVQNGKVHYSSQKAISQAADGSFEQATTNELQEQEISIVDSNTLIVDGKTLKKGVCN